MSTALIPVPNEYRLRGRVERDWSRIRKSIWDGRSVDFDIESLDKVLAERNDEIEKRLLDMAYDWRGDLDSAKWLHNWNKQWMTSDLKFRDDKVELWNRLISRMEDFSEKVALSGLSLVFAAHGAVALGALKILSERPIENQHIYLSAKFALILSVFGVLSFTVGKLLIFMNLMHFSGRIRYKMLGNVSNLKYRAFEKYIYKYRNYITLGDKIVYFSIFIFLLNISISGIVLTL